MSIILKGIDLPKHGETKRIVLYDNGDIILDEDGWDEDGNRFYKTSYDVQAIQIPKGHGRLIDADYIKALYYEFSPPEEDAPEGVMAEVTELFDMRALDEAPTILEAEE